MDEQPCGQIPQSMARKPPSYSRAAAVRDAPAHVRTSPNPEDGESRGAARLGDRLLVSAAVACDFIYTLDLVWRRTRVGFGPRPLGTCST
jgi:hypothetical protein